MAIDAFADVRLPAEPGHFAPATRDHRPSAAVGKVIESVRSGHQWYWEDRGMDEELKAGISRSSGRTKFLIGGLLIIAAIIYLIVSSTQASAQYYMTIDELMAKKAEVADRDLRISGAVEGSTIQYDAQSLTLEFTIVNVPADMQAIEDAGGLAAVLHQAVTDPTATRLPVVYEGPMPDLMRDEAQAIVTGRLGADGVFHAEELLLKCPTRYEEEVPVQAAET
jgi:cytochrome c-type biogenesis protein CcmE